MRNYVEKIEVLEENNQYRIGEIGFSAAQKHRHKGETYGISVKIKPRSVSLISDARSFPERLRPYRGEILMIHEVRLKPVGEESIDHLSIPLTLPSRCWETVWQWNA